MEFVIKVPGSSANLGCGFDTLAVAISVYLIVYVNYDNQTCYRIKNLSNMDIETDIESNLILKTARMVACLFDLELPFVELRIKNEIPLKRGMGSSSAAIVAGIVLADRLCNLSLSKEQMLNIGFLLEPHTDNISASLYGNLTISLTNNIESEYLGGGAHLRELFANGKLLIKDLPSACSSLSLEVTTVPQNSYIY
jgi:homoserine kinase